MLVCMGAAIVMAMGHYMQEAFQTGDPARLGAQVISGIGFYSAGILATLAVYLIMARFKKLEYKFILEDVYCGVYVEFNGTVTISDIAQRISGYGLEIEEVQMGKPGYGALADGGHRGRPVRKIHILKIMEKALPVWDYLRWVVLFAKATI